MGNIRVLRQSPNDHPRKDRPTCGGEVVQLPAPAPTSRAPLWPLVASGNYTADCDSGRAFADDLVTRMEREGMPNLLGATVKAINAGGHWGGLEVGFFQRFAELSMRA